MENLFTEIENEARLAAAPLAVRMRPRTLDELEGQRDAVGPGSWLHAAIQSDALSSVILFGPAGTGKTSIAHIVAETTRAAFVEVSAIGGTVADLRREIAAAEKRLVTTGGRTILFVDEIHRFNRSQQDALLHAVENRTVVLIGATTENPFFEVNSALISRSRVIELHSLSDADIERIVARALSDERGLAGEFSLGDGALSAIVNLSGGDARSALATLELAASLARERDAASGRGAEGARDAEEGEPAAERGRKPAASSGPAGASGASSAVGRGPLSIEAADVELATPHRALPYDKNKDMHYDVISAFIKSMRGSDPDAALYWLARMIDGGEDPKFIARRIFILASEDIGNADPQALLIAEAAFRAVEVIGLPECRINLAQAVTYMALAPKSNAAEAGIDAALSEVRRGPKRDVPSYLRDRHRPGSENYGEYKYPHNYPGHWVEQRYLPDGLERGCFYHPGEAGWEAYRVDAVARDRASRSQQQRNGGA